jgi:hypothetical protein
MPEEILVSGKLKNVVDDIRKDQIRCTSREWLNHGFSDG